MALIVLFVGALWGQAEPDGGVSSQNQSSQSPAQTQTSPAEVPAGDTSASGPEKVVSPKEAKELFRSVDEILKFASDDTALPIKHAVKRRLTKRDEVQSYIEKGMKDDKDAKRLERSHFCWPSAASCEMRLSHAQLMALVEGLDWKRVRAVDVQAPQSVS